MSDEETIASYDEFQNAEKLYLPVRAPGSDVWDFVQKSVE
jgi:hypothetical protein